MEKSLYKEAGNGPAEDYNRTIAHRRRVLENNLASASRETSQPPSTPSNVIS